MLKLMFLCAFACGLGGCSLATNFDQYRFVARTDAGSPDAGLCPASSLPCHTECIPDGVLLCNDGVFGECQPKPGTRYLCDDAGNVLDAGPEDAGPIDADADLDGGMPPEDGGPDTDAGFDAGTDSGSTDGGRPDTGTDAGRGDSGMDAGPGDAGSDAGPADSGGPRDSGVPMGCPTNPLGPTEPIPPECAIELRVTYGNSADMRPAVTGYFFNRTEPGGSPTGWLGTECYGDVVRVDTYTTTCRIHWVPVSGTVVKFYVTVGGTLTSPCGNSTCDGIYPDGVRMTQFGMVHSAPEIVSFYHLTVATATEATPSGLLKVFSFTVP